MKLSSTVCSTAIAILASAITVTTAWAQVKQGNNVISGVVVDSVSGMPIPNVNVFLQGTTKGTVSGNDGVYELNGLPDGDYELIMSVLGFERRATPIVLVSSYHLRVNAKLKPRAISIAQVDVTGSADTWKQLLPVFESVFLGTTPNAARCRILNPEVISLSIGSTGDSLQAHTDSTLIVENEALGYRVFVEIDSCLILSRGSRFALRWFPRYVEMKPANKEEEDKWKDRREECYRYSFIHFLRSAASHRLRKDDFRVTTGELGYLLRARGEELSGDQIRVTSYRDSMITAIDFMADQIRVDRMDDFGSWKASMEYLLHPDDNPGPLLAPSTRPEPDMRPRSRRNTAPANNDGKFEKPPAQDEMVEKYSTIVRIKDRPLLVNRTGHLMKPFAVVLNGYWETLRLSDTLPSDYEPSEPR